MKKKNQTFIKVDKLKGILIDPDIWLCNHIKNHDKEIVLLIKKK